VAIADLPQPPALSLLEARHVDNLVESVRALAMNVVQLADLIRDQIVATKINTQAVNDKTAATREQVVATRELADLLKATHATANGHTPPTPAKRRPRTKKRRT
jgi:hypothetical protein